MTTDAAASRAEDTGRVGELLQTMSRLIAVLEREIEMLRTMEPQEMQALQEEKIVLAAAYESRLQSLRDDPPGPAELDDTLRAELQQTTARFQGTLAENERMLRAARQASERLLQAIAQSLQRQDAERSGYSAAGRPRAGVGTPGQPMTLDQRL
jgi:transketolase